MDSSAWIGFSILIIVVLLLGYVRKASEGSSKKRNKLFNRITQENKLKIIEKTSWDHGILGIDTGSNQILVVHELNHELQHVVIDLNSIGSCEVVHERNPQSTRIILRFEVKDTQHKLLELMFYDSTVDSLANITELKEKAQNVKDTVLDLMKKKIQ